MDDTGGGGRWDMATAAANARRAVEDASAIAFIGDLDSGATRITLPITNQAEMLQISPGATARDLTRRVSAELEPGRYRPSDEQTFVRLVPSEMSAGICAAYGYEAMSLILEAVRSEGADRRQVIDAVLATEGRRSRIGTYSITEPGDIRFDNQNSDPCARPAQP